MITNLQYLGIYSGAIDDSIGEVELAMQRLGFSTHEIQEMHEIAYDEMCEVGRMDDITNSIIDCYFNTAKDVIKRRFPDLNVDFYVNCTDSHFYINGEEQV